MKINTLKTNRVPQRFKPNTCGGYQVNPQSQLYKFIKTQVNRITYLLSLQVLNPKLSRNPRKH